MLEESLLRRDSDTSSMRSILGRLLDLSEQQGRLLESLLTLAKSEGGLDRRGPLDLAEIAERMVRTAEGTGPRVGGDNPRARAGEGTAPELTGTAPGPVRQSVPELRENLWGRLPAPPMVTGTAHAATAGYPALVERLIANLLDNAVRYNVPGGRVEISTRVEGDKAIVSIANTGPVIPPEQVHCLFDPFQRLDRTRVDDHHGLGLCIVRASAIAHAATLTANARPQGGLS
jgi:signal transduction histidine kinase